VDRERRRQPVLVRVERQLRGAERPDAANQLRQESALPAHDLDQGLDLGPEDNVLEDRVTAKQEGGRPTLCTTLRLLRKAQAGFPQALGELERRHVAQNRVALVLQVVDVLRHVEALHLQGHGIQEVERLPRFGHAVRRGPRPGPPGRPFELRGRGLRHRRTLLCFHLDLRHDATERRSLPLRTRTYTWCRSAAIVAAGPGATRTPAMKALGLSTFLGYTRAACTAPRGRRPPYRLTPRHTLIAAATQLPETFATSHRPSGSDRTASRRRRRVQRVETPPECQKHRAKVLPRPHPRPRVRGRLAAGGAAAHAAGGAVDAPLRCTSAARRTSGQRTGKRDRPSSRRETSSWRSTAQAPGS